MHAPISRGYHKVGMLVKRNTLVPSPVASAIRSVHVTKGLGKQSKPQSGGNLHMVCDVMFIFTMLKTNTIKANAHCFAVVSAITEYWHTKCRYVRYVWFGESLQKHPKSIAKSLSQRLGSKQRSHYRYNLTVSQSITRCPWANTFVCSYLGCGTDPIFIHFCRSPKSDANKQGFKMKLNLTCKIKLNQPPKQ